MICQPRLPRPALTITLIVVALLSWYFGQQHSPKSQAEDNGTPHVPSYFVRNLEAVTMNDQGAPARSMQSSYVVQFLDDETTEMAAPSFSIFRPDEPPWDIHSEQGWLSADGELALLSGRVTIIRPASLTTAPMKMVTSDLRIQPSNNYIETDNAVDANSGNDHIEAIGMQAWLEQPGRIKFLSQVRAKYEPR